MIIKKLQKELEEFRKNHEKWSAIQIVKNEKMYSISENKTPAHIRFSGFKLAVKILREGLTNLRVTLETLDSTKNEYEYQFTTIDTARAKAPNKNETIYFSLITAYSEANSIDTTLPQEIISGNTFDHYINIFNEGLLFEVDTMITETNKPRVKPKQKATAKLRIDAKNAQSMHFYIQIDNTGDKPHVYIEENQ